MPECQNLKIQQCENVKLRKCENENAKILKNKIKHKSKCDFLKNKKMPKW